MQIDLRPTDDNDKVAIKTFDHKHWSLNRITPKNNPYGKFRFVA